MNNTQKILLIFGIVGIIVILEVWLCSIMDNCVEDTLNKLEGLITVLKEENYEESKSKSEDLYKKWFEYENKLLLFVEHDEVENVSAKVAVIMQNVANSQYKIALEDVEETKYLLEHIKDKNRLKLKNVF